MFVDTSGWGCLADPSQGFHTKAGLLFQQTSAVGILVTTSLVLAELVALLTRPLRMPKLMQVRFLRDVRTDPSVEVVHIDPALDTAAWQLWESRPDKDWSFVDCASFVVMQRRGLTDALTTDHHFEQAGFVRLLK